ncbi:MAG: hydrogenase maturation nickel metallochaperone HypA [Candidatus Aminicenantes bacterium]|nr:hydrogenase maturation nickel metallochaperone HypA [Candidatus Aminicenantes bacterium]
MHEGAIATTIIQNILEVREQEKFASIKTATVLIGRLHHVVPEVLQNHFRLLKKEHPPLIRCKLVIKIAPVAITCRGCNKVTVLEQAAFVCPACASTAIEITGGREMHLKDIIGVRQHKLSTDLGGYSLSAPAKGRKAEGVGLKNKDKIKGQKK